MKLMIPQKIEEKLIIVVILIGSLFYRYIPFHMSVVFILAPIAFIYIFFIRKFRHDNKALIIMLSLVTLALIPLILAGWGHYFVVNLITFSTWRTILAINIVASFLWILSLILYIWIISTSPIKRRNPVMTDVLSILILLFPLYFLNPIGSIRDLNNGLKTYSGPCRLNIYLSSGGSMGTRYHLLIAPHYDRNLRITENMYDSLQDPRSTGDACLHDVSVYYLPHTSYAFRE